MNDFIKPWRLRSTVGQSMPVTGLATGQGRRPGHRDVTATVGRRTDFFPDSGDWWSRQCSTEIVSDAHGSRPRLSIGPRSFSRRAAQSWRDYQGREIVRRFSFLSSSLSLCYRALSYPYSQIASHTTQAKANQYSIPSVTCSNCRSSFPLR